MSMETLEQKLRERALKKLHDEVNKPIDAVRHNSNPYIGHAIIKDKDGKEIFHGHMYVENLLRLVASFQIEARTESAVAREIKQFMDEVDSLKERVEELESIRQ